MKIKSNATKTTVGRDFVTVFAGAWTVILDRSAETETIDRVIGDCDNPLNLIVDRYSKQIRAIIKA